MKTLVALILLLILDAVGAAPIPLLYAPFDGDMQSSGSLGTVTPATSMAGPFVPGVRGQARRLGGKNTAVYYVDRDFLPPSGTCSLWVAPIDWTAATADHFVFFTSFNYTGAEGKYVRVLLYKVYNETSLTLLVQNTIDGEKAAFAKAPIEFWQRGEWHHLAFTWDPDRYRLYVDGKPAGEAKTVTLPSGGRWEIMVGTPYDSWAYIGNETTAVDEFTIWPEALGAEEIKRMYDEVTPGLPKAAGRKPALPGTADTDDLALRRNGAFVLASSFRDVTTNYSDNLIDGDETTVWRPHEAELPQWLEVRWPLPVRVDEVVLAGAGETLAPSAGGVFAAYAWEPGRHDWRRLEATAEVAEGRVRLRFAETETQRLRVVIEQGEASQLALSELIVHGPPQPQLARLKPYWKAAYIWHQEPDEIYQPNEPRFFRQTFEVADPAQVRSAVLQLRSNDSYHAWLNGVEVASGSTNIAPIAVADKLVKGKNVLAVEAELHSNPGRWTWGELLFELALNYDDRTEYVASGEQTRTAATKQEGWLAAGFDDSAWQPAARFFAPPEGPWGQIPYYAKPVGEKAALARFAVSPAKPQPGQRVGVEVTLEPGGALRDDYFFVLQVGEDAVRPDLDNFDVAAAPLSPATPSSQWAAGQPQKLVFTFDLPLYAPEGTVPVRLEAYGTKNGMPLEITGAKGEVLKQIGELTIPPRAGDRRVRDGRAHAARLGLTTQPGAAALQVGTQVEPPVMWSLQANSWERTGLYGGTGVHLYHVHSGPTKIDEQPETLALITRQLDQRAANLLRVDPQAQFIIDLELRPSMAWLEAHPEDRLVTAQGTLGPQSYCSARHLADVQKIVTQVTTFLMSRPYADRIVGYMPMTCGAPDSTMGGVEANLFQTDRSKVTVGDFSPQALAAFRQWLKARYGTVEKLRAAWHDPQASFDNVKLDIHELTREGAEGGVFRDPRDSAATLDCFDFLSGVMGRFYAQVMRTIKQLAPQALVGAYYGYNVAHMYGYNNPGSQFNGNNYDLYERLSDPNWDFYAGPIPYESRGSGVPYKNYQATSSILLHGKLLMNELDHRTFIAGATTYGRLHSPREAEAILKRDIGGSLVDGSGYWFADWSAARGRDGVGWFTDPSILQTVRETTAAGTKLLQQPRSLGSAQVALFVHGATMGCMDIYRSEPIFYNLVARTVWEEMSRMGAPYDTYLLEDLADQRVRDGYKLYVLLDPFLLTAKERALIEDLKRDGKTVLWFYAPGYADRETGLSDSNIAALTGFSVTHTGPGEIMRYRITNTASPITQGLAPGQEYALAEYGYELSRKLHPAAFGPVFRIEGAGDAALATYPDGGVALAAKDFGTWKSVYCAVPYMSAEVLRGVCRYAQVHLYCQENVVLKADNRCLMVHNGPQARELTLALPTRCDVSDLCSGEVLGKGTQSLDLKMAATETRLLGLTPSQGR